MKMLLPYRMCNFFLAETIGKTDGKKQCDVEAEKLLGTCTYTDYLKTI